MAFGVIIRDKNDKKPTRYFSNKQEKIVAKTLGGVQTRNSGATPWQKGDVNIDNSSFLIECKTKTQVSNSISIRKEWLEKNKQEALFMGKKYSALAFNFGPDQDNYYIIDKYLMEDLINFLKNN